MAGTKMTLRKYGAGASPFDYFELIVDQAYVDEGNGLLVTLTHPYIPGLHMLDVTYNGQYLSSGGGYEEVDAFHILLDLRGTEGEKLTEFEDGDEVIVRIWKQPPPARSNLEDQLRQLQYIFGEGNYDIDYQYDSNGEMVVQESVTGDYNISKAYTYNELGKPLTETVTYANRQVVTEYIYDPVTYNLLKVRVRTTIT